MIGAGGAGKSTTDERGLVAGTFFAGAVGLTGAATFWTFTIAFSGGFAGGETFLTGFAAIAFLRGGAFLAGAGFFAGAAGFAAFGAGFFAVALGFAAATGFAGLAAGFAGLAAGFFAFAAGFAGLASGFFAFAAGFADFAAGFAGLTAGFAFPFWGAGFEVGFFAAMAQRSGCG